MEGRQILDVALIGNEAIDSLLKSNSCGLICKLDIEAAYDYVSWSFLLMMLKKMGFGDRWISWIEWCISTLRFSILVNDSSLGFFQSSKGLRQEDPFSSYFFVIVMETFNCLLKRAKVEGFLSRWQVRGNGRKGVDVSHLLFADDMLVFCEPSPN